MLPLDGLSDIVCSELHKHRIGVSVDDNLTGHERHVVKMHAQNLFPAIVCCAIEQSTRLNPLERTPAT